ncbi:MAG: YihY/virulence factor BrkB family protein [Lachnospiraceae bacterium]|jgi:membrane protein
MYTDAYISIKSFFIKLGRDRIYTFSATTAFFIILSIFPFLILLLAAMQFTPLTKEFLQERVFDVLPELIAPLINGIIEEIYASQSGAGLIFASALGALWSASKGVMSLIRGIGVCFNVNDKRNYFVVRLISCFYTLIFYLMLVLMMVLFVFGRTIYNLIRTHLGGVNDFIQFIVHQRYFIGIVLLTLLFMTMFKFLPAKKNRFLRMFPGAFLAASAWVALSSLLSLYVKHFPNISYIYGSLTSFILLMMWLYIGMYIIFVCAEINFFINITFSKWERRRLSNKAQKYQSKMETKKIKTVEIKNDEEESVV